MTIRDLLKRADARSVSAPKLIDAKCAAWPIASQRKSPDPLVNALLGEGDTNPLAAVKTTRRSISDDTNAALADIAKAEARAKAWLALADFIDGSSDHIPNEVGSHIISAACDARAGLKAGGVTGATLSAEIRRAAEGALRDCANTKTLVGRRKSAAVFAFAKHAQKYLRDAAEGMPRKAAIFTRSAKRFEVLAERAQATNSGYRKRGMV